MIGKCVPWFSLLMTCPVLAADTSNAGNPSYPLLDGKCEEYAAIAQSRHEVGESVTLHLFQDRDYVWVCYTLPPDSFGTSDMMVAAPGLSSPLNLHVSAQLGEWPANDPDAAPSRADSPKWWNQDGWSGTTIQLNSASAALDEAGKPRVNYNFIRTRGRELQLSKARFGRGEWRWHIEIRNVADGKGGQRAFRFPATGEQLLTVD